MSTKKKIDYFKKLIKPYLIRVISIIICISLVFTSMPVYAYTAINAGENIETEDVSREESSANNSIGEESLEDTLSLEEEASVENALIEESTEDSTTFDLGDGKKMIIYHGQDVRYTDAGELIDYDPTLVEIDSNDISVGGKELEGYKFENKQGDKKHYIPEVLSENTPVLMENDKYSIEMVPLETQTSQEAQAKIEEVLTPYETVEEKEVTAVYEVENQPHRYEYTSLNEGIKETIVLEENPKNNVFRFKLNVKGLEAEYLEEENTIVFMDKNTKEVKATIEKPFMNDRSNEAYSEDLQYALEESEEEGEYILILTVSREYLDDEERLYPVTIDPTATWTGSDTFLDTYVISGSIYQDINFYSSGTKIMPVGLDGDGYIHRTYIKFPNVKANLGDKYIDSAYLTVYETAQCEPNQSIRFSRIIEDWSPSTITWNNRPDYYSYINTFTTTGTTYASHKVTMTNTFRNYVNETNNPNYGIVTRNITDNPTYAEFFGSRTSASAYRPKLVITYYDKPTVAETLTVSRLTDDVYVTSSYMKKWYNVYATWSGISSHNLADVQYKLIAGDDNTPEPTSISSDEVDLTKYRSIGVTSASGSNVRIPYLAYIPAGKYRLYLRGKDAGGMYGEAKYVVFYVDDDTPSITNVSVSPTTSSSAPSTDLTPTVNWNASDKYFSKVEVSLNGTVLTTVTTSGSGSYTIPSGKITSTGTHTIKVTVTDKSGKTNSVSKSYYADTLAPSLSNVTLTPATSSSSFTTDLTPQISWTATDNNFKNVTIYLDDVLVKTVTDSGSQSYTFPTGKITKSGTYKIKIIASDNAGRTTSKTLNYYVDTVAPSFSSASSVPTTSAENPSKILNPQIKWNVSESNLSKITISIAGGTEVTVSTTAGEGSYVIPKDKITTSGSKSIKITAYDKAGNSSSKYVTYHADAYLPQIEKLETSPLGHYTEPSGNLTPTINWYATDYYFTKTEIYLNDNLLYTTTVDGEGSYTVPSGKITESGGQKITLKCYDKAGQVNSKSVTYYADAYLPQIEKLETSPLGHYTEPAGDLTPTINWYATDYYFTKTEIYLNDKLLYTTTTPGEGTYTVPFGMITESGGQKITLKCYDKAGKVNSKYVTYYADAYLPQIEKFELDPTTSKSKPTVNLTPTVNWYATDYYFTKTEIYLGDTLLHTTTVAGEGNYTIPNGKISTSGEYQIKLKCYDKAGKVNTKTIVYYVDVTKPVINDIQITPKTSFLNRINNKSPKVTWKVTDSNLKSVMYSLDGVTYKQMGTESQGSFNIPANVWVDGSGEYTLYFKATDIVNNTSAVVEKTYYLGESGSFEPQDMSISESYGKRVLTWSLQAYDPDNSQYNIHRGTTSNFEISNDTLIAEDIDASTLCYIDNEVLDAGTYYYKIEVKDLTGDENAQDILSEEVSINNTITEDSFKDRTGLKNYLSYFNFGTPTGTGYIEKSNGNVMYVQDDYSVSNSQFDFGLSRTYNSKLNITGMVGKGWSDSYHKELYTDGDNIYYLDSNGSVLEFVNNDGQYTCEETRELRLTKVSDGYELEDKSGTIYSFNSFGQLVSTRENNGCKLEFSYDLMGRMIAVTAKGFHENGDETTEVEEKITLVYEEDSYLLKEIRDLLGNVYSYEYSGNLLTQLKITDANNSSNTVSYNYGYSLDTLLNKVYDALGNCYEITYSSGRGNKVTYPNDEYYIITYKNAETDVTKVNEDGNTVYTESINFDSNTGKLTKVTDVKGRTTLYYYESQNPYLVTKEVKKGYYQSLNGDSVVLNNEKTETVTYSYDEEENITEETSDDSTSVYTYDENNNIKTEVVTENGNVVNDIEYEYDQYGNVITYVDTEEKTYETYCYDTAGNQVSSEYFNISTETNENIPVSSTSAEYDEMGNPVTEVITSGELETTITNSYDDMGVLLTSTEDRSDKDESLISPAGTVSISKQIETIYTNDFLGRTIKTDTVITQYDEKTGNNETVTYSEYKEYNDNGSLTKEIDNNGKVTSYEFDSLNRKTKTTVSGTGIGTAVSETVYGYANNVIIHDGIDGRSESIAYTETYKEGNIVTSKKYMDIEGNTIKIEAGTTYTCYTYDNDGTQVISYKGSTTEDQWLIDLTLQDSEGHVFTNVSNARVQNGNYVVASDSIKTSSTYDSEGNVATQTDGEGTITSFSYDDKKITAYCIDGNQDIAVSYVDGEDGSLTTTITDAKGNQKIEVTNQAGATTSIIDKGSNESERIESNYTYDSLGNNTLVQYGDGSYIANEYDVNGRVYRSKSYATDGTLEKTSEYEYDINGHITVARLVEADGVTEKYAENFTYDSNGTLIKKGVVYGGDEEKEITYSYDNQGRLVSVTYPTESSLGTVSYAYSDLGNLVAIKQNGSLVTEYIYDGFYRIKERKDYTSAGASSYILRSYTYDNLNRVTSMVYSQNGQGVIESYSYVYDKNNNIVSETHVNNLSSEVINETKDYTYDSYGRLTKTVTTDHNDNDSQSTVEYGYDSVGNRTTLIEETGTTTYSYNGLNQLVNKQDSTGTTSYSYDGRGNQIRESGPSGTVDYGYAVTGELLSVTSEDTLVQQNEYNHNGIRVARTEGNVTRNYFYDNESVVYTTDNGSVSTANILGGYQNVIGSYRGGEYYTYSKDIQGSTSSITDNNFNAVAIYEYSDFGEVEEVVESIDNEICYTGAIQDETTGLHYMNARYYDSSNGRFISQDSYRGSVNEPSQWHLYVYCANNPINYVDPSGHKIVTFGFKAEAALVVGGYAFVSVNWDGSNFAICITAGFKIVTNGFISGSVCLGLSSGKVDDLKGWSGSIGVSVSIKNVLSLNGSVGISGSGFSVGACGGYSPKKFQKTFGVKVYWDLELGHTKQLYKFKWNKVKSKEKTYTIGNKKIKVKKVDGKVRVKFSNYSYKAYFYKNGNVKVTL